MDGYWVIRTYESGDIGEKIKFWIPGERPTRSAARLKSEIKKQEQNEASAVKRVARLIHANFRSGTDYLIGLDYAGPDWDEGEPEEIYKSAERELRLYLRRVRRASAAAGIPFRYIAVTSDMDGRTGACVRIHHHLIVNAEAINICREKWCLGGFAPADNRHGRLYDVRDQTGLALYLLQQVRWAPDEKKYIPSRNLHRPQPKDRIAPSGSELRFPRHSKPIVRTEYRPGAAQYIRYIIDRQ